MSWPNRITIFRLLLVTPFILLLLYGAENAGYRYGALVLALTMGILDAVDGYIARRTGTVTRTGSILDPVADYAFTISALVTMSFSGILSASEPDLRLPYWASVTLVARSLFMLCGMAILYFLSGFFQGLPSISGKAASGMQVVMIATMCVAPDLVPLAPQIAWPALHVIWGVTVGLGVISWLGYIRTGSKLLTAGNHTA
jgi:cardiolipin synthase (CMP-forming)